MGSSLNILSTSIYENYKMGNSNTVDNYFGDMRQFS